MEAERQARWTPSPRARRLACHRRERGIRAFYARLRRAMGEGWGEGRFCRVQSCPLHPLTPPLRGDPLPQGERVTEPAARPNALLLRLLLRTVKPNHLKLLVAGDFTGRPAR